MRYFFLRATGQAHIDALLCEAGARWEALAQSNSQLSPGEQEALFPPVDPEVEIPQPWASSFALLPYADQVVLGFAWLQWWQQAPDVEPGFAGWLLKGPGFALNHLSLLSVLTRDQAGVLSRLHDFLETILEQAGDWNGDRGTGQAIVQLLEKLDREYRSNIHDRELWPAVLQIL